VSVLTVGREEEGAGNFPKRSFSPLSEGALFFPCKRKMNAMRYLQGKKDEKRHSKGETTISSKRKSGVPPSVKRRRRVKGRKCLIYRVVILPGGRCFITFPQPAKCLEKEGREKEGKERRIFRLS